MDSIVKIVFFLVALVIAYTFATYISKHYRFSFLYERTNRLGAIDGLRGYLALFVFAHHFILTWYWKNTTHWWRPKEVYFQNIGLIGVMIFFMITGYLFTTKILEKKHKTNWLKLYISRIFRIYPLYLFALFVISVIIFINPEHRVNLNFSLFFSQYCDWLLFNGVNLHTHDHSHLIIAGVEWTLRYEWFFYLSLPFIAFIITLNRWFALLLSLFAALYFYQNERLFSFETVYFLFFIIGGLAAVLYRYLETYISKYIDNFFVSFIITVALFYAIFYKNIFDPVAISLISLFFISIAWGNSLFGLMHKRASILLGEISYSIYLLHGVVIYMLFTIFEIIDLKRVSIVEHTFYMPLIVPLVLVMAVFTYLFIEKPGIELGKAKILQKK